MAGLQGQLVKMRHKIITIYGKYIGWFTHRTIDELKVSLCSPLPEHEKRSNRKWQDYVYIQCEYKSTKQKIKHLLREENKVKENKIS